MIIWLGVTFSATPTCCFSCFSLSLLRRPAIALTISFSFSWDGPRMVRFHLVIGLCFRKVLPSAYNWRHSCARKEELVFRERSGPSCQITGSTRQGSGCGSRNQKDRCGVPTKRRYSEVAIGGKKKTTCGMWLDINTSHKVSWKFLPSISKLSITAKGLILTTDKHYAN